MPNKPEKINPKHNVSTAKVEPRDSSNDRGYNAAWRAIRYLHLRKFPVCELCKAPATDVHHRVDRRKGGNNTTENLCSLCHRCHSRETARRRSGSKKKIDYFEEL